MSTEAREADFACLVYKSGCKQSFPINSTTYGADISFGRNEFVKFVSITEIDRIVYGRTGVDPNPCSTDHDYKLENREDSANFVQATFESNVENLLPLHV